MRQEGKRVVCEVIDNGRGVEPQIRSRLFEPFATTREASGGTGLGLAVSRDLIRAAGGELELVQTGPTGTTFRLRLPALDGESSTGSRQAELVATALPSPRPVDR
jgi:signal transduction histidine kinase